MRNLRSFFIKLFELWFHFSKDLFCSSRKKLILTLIKLIVPNLFSRDTLSQNLEIRDIPTDFFPHSLKWKTLMIFATHSLGITALKPWNYLNMIRRKLQNLNLQKKKNIVLWTTPSYPILSKSHLTSDIYTTRWQSASILRSLGYILTTKSDSSLFY